MGTGIKGKFTDTNDQVVPPYITVRPEVIAALGALVRSGGTMDIAPTPPAPWAFCAAAPPFPIWWTPRIRKTRS